MHHIPRFCAWGSPAWGDPGARTGAAGEEGTGLARVVNGRGCGVDLVGGLGDEPLLDEVIDGGDVGVTEGGGLTDGAEYGREDLLDVQRLDVGEDVGVGEFDSHNFLKFFRVIYTNYLRKRCPRSCTPPQRPHEARSCSER